MDNRLSVTATHHLLKLEDKHEIRKEIPMYFPHLDVRLWFVEDYGKKCISTSSLKK